MAQRAARFEFSLPHTHGLVNRYVTSTLGSRSTAAGQQAGGGQGLELEPNETGDLLYVKGDLEAYLDVSTACGFATSDPKN
jgi:allophanate hydrolase subunit 2